MIITYRGKKNPLILNLPYLAKKYEFSPGVGVDVVDNDGRLLVGKFPQSFITDAALDEVDLDSDIFTDSGADGDAYERGKAIAEQAIQSTVGAVNSSTPECVIVGSTTEQGPNPDAEPADETEDDFTFETDEKGESYLCPLCDKTYKVNKGRGKRVMVEHLEKDHADEWLELQTRPDVDVDQK